MGYRNRSCRILVACLAMAMTAMPAFAQGTGKDPFELTAHGAAEFRGQADALRDEMDTGRYTELSERDKATVHAQLARLQAIYDKHARRERVDTIPHGIAVVNASEIINGVLAGDADDRLVCEQVKKAGSNRIEKCATARERRLIALGAQKGLRRWYRPSPSAGCELATSRCLGGLDGLRRTQGRVP